MLDFAPPIQKAYERTLKKVGDVDPYAGHGFLGINDVLKAHFLLVDFFYAEGSGLGGIGPKNIDLLHSALFRQHVSFGGISKWSSKYEVCATLFYGLIKDHAFYDANKRTAFLTLVYHLETLGMCTTLEHKELENFAVMVADDKLKKFKRYKSYLASGQNKDDAAVRFIGDYIRRNSRNVDKKYYRVTFRELKRILNKFGYDLQNPNGNVIDIMRLKTRRRIFGVFGEREQIGVRVGQIGFPSWTEQVGKGAIKTVRTSARLTYKDGVDSQTFFKDADPLSILISRYQAPLRALSER